MCHELKQYPITKQHAKWRRVYLSTNADCFVEQNEERHNLQAPVPTLTLSGCRIVSGPAPRKSFCCVSSSGWGSWTCGAHWESKGAAPLTSSALVLEHEQQG